MLIKNLYLTSVKQRYNQTQWRCDANSTSQCYACVTVYRPDAPEPRVVSEVHATSCTVTCQPPRRDGGAPCRYILERRTPGPDSEWIIVNDSPITGLQYTVDNLTQATQYEFRVAAVNKTGTGEFSLTCPLIVTPVEKPGRPACPEVLEVIGTSVRLQWTAPDSDGGAAITQYAVVYSIRDDTKYVSFPIPVEVTAGQSTTYTLRNTLHPYTKYRFAVAAVNSVGTGPRSEYTRYFTTFAGTL